MKLAARGLGPLVAKTLALVAGVSLVLLACSDSTDIASIGAGENGGPPGFTSDDASTNEAATEGGLISYCPSSECPKGRTTCDTSKFRCDVNVQTDKANCGACGMACPKGTSHETYACIEGRCIVTCNPGPLGDPSLDCDGLPDNGCEISAVTNDNCGACGKKCVDPAKPCVRIGDTITTYETSDVDCGCSGDDLYCPGHFWDPKWVCVQGKIDDNNCGKCGRACDRTGGGKGPPPSYMYYGCADGECEHLKCVNFRGDCDHDISNGCEVDLISSENCGACGKVCAPGTTCGLATSGPECMCARGKTRCGRDCVDLASDIKNCGACGLECPWPLPWAAGGWQDPHVSPICVYGECAQQCTRGHADCNGNDRDGCETNTDSDPMNCGACGKVCDGVDGQACVDGRCVVQPCRPDQDAGEIPR